MVSASANRQQATSVLIIGDGVIGLSTAYALGRAGAECVLVGARNPGMASTAAAGLLLPNIDDLAPNVRRLFATSLEQYPAFVDRLREFDSGLKLLGGVVEVTSGSGSSARRRPDDAAIDNVRLVSALREAVAAQPTVSVIDDDAVISIDLGSGRVRVGTRSGEQFTADRVVLAAGAWSPQIDGLPRPLRVHPLKGQMLALAASSLQGPVVADDVYLVPRGDETLVGATVELAGFDCTVDSAAIEILRAAAVRVCPNLASAAIARTWAGTRPATPDMLPILGADPDDERLVYACGHSKNGILLAPATAEAVCELLLEGASRIDLAAFSPARFDATK